MPAGKGSTTLIPDNQRLNIINLVRPSGITDLPKNRHNYKRDSWNKNAEKKIPVGASEKKPKQKNRIHDKSQSSKYFIKIIDQFKHRPMLSDLVRHLIIILVIHIYSIYDISYEIITKNKNNTCISP